MSNSIVTTQTTTTTSTTQGITTMTSKLNRTILNNLTIQNIMADVAGRAQPRTSFESLADECSYIQARGEQRIGLVDLASVFVPTLINHIEELVTPVDVKVYPSEQDSSVQCLDASIKMVLCTIVAKSGHVDLVSLETALDNWLESDTPTYQDGSAVELDSAYIAENFHISLVQSRIASDTSGYARMDDGAYYSVYTLSEAVRTARNVAFQKLIDEAKPRMQPMQFPITWKLDGTCEIKNLQLVGGPAIITEEFVLAANKASQSAFIVNEEVLEHLEAHQYDEVELPEDESLHMEILDKKELENITIDALCELPRGVALYFPHSADWRGRLNARGGLTTPQGIKACRSAFDFADTLMVDDEAEFGVRLHVANCLGMDKAPINERIQWTKDNQAEILANEYVKPYEFRAQLALQELVTYRTSNVVCHIDGTSNGTQHTAAMFRDAKTGALVNITPATFDTAVNDFYGTVAEYAQKLAKGVVREALELFGRDLTKNAIMVAGYGACPKTIQTGLAEFLAEKNFKCDVKALARVISASIQAKAPALTRLTTIIKKALKGTGISEATWNVGDMQVIAKSTTTQDGQLKGSSYNATLLNSRQEDADGFARALSPNFVHSLDSAHLRSAIREVSCPVSPIHDSLGVPAGAVSAAMKTLAVTFQELHSIDQLNVITSAIGAPMTAPQGDLDITRLDEAVNMFS